MLHYFSNYDMINLFPVGLHSNLITSNSHQYKKKLTRNAPVRV